MVKLSYRVISMYIYKMSPTRAIGHLASYDNPIFSGSSLNRKFKNEDKILKETQEAKRNKIHADETLIELWECEDFKRKNNFFQTSNDLLPDGSEKLLAPVPVLRPRRLSARSKYKIRDKIETLYNCTPNAKFTFLTLTFINKVDDKQAQKVLNKFLTVARKKFGVFLYIWVAERQTDTKNIHFHIIANKRFPIQYFNALWVLQQYNAGIFNDSYDHTTITSHIENGTLQGILNPVDVKAIKGINALSIYLTMYVTKNTDSFRCSVWHCCRSVSRLFTTQLITKDTFEAAQQPQLNSSVNINTGEIYEAKTFVSEHAIVVNILNKKYFSKSLQELNLLNSWILKDKDFCGKLPTIDFMEYNNLYCNESDTPSRFVFADIIDIQLQTLFKNNAQSAN